ncbi:MAG: MraY family glycosyltransferase [Candidatus Omnitrophica bacterium]|nr:MraY family glycosyltransferase [Candidatus Omnitrophota bacterium]
MIFGSFLIGVVLVLVLMKLSRKYKFLIPKGMPLVGGIAFGVSFLASSLLFFFFHQFLPGNIKGLLLSSSIILVAGIIDDIHELSVLFKFSFQILATILIVMFGVRTYIVGIGGTLNLIITFIWIIGITNAFNHLDVVDGLCAGTALVVSLAFCAIALLNGDLLNAALTLALCGAVISFLRYNLPPARVYMGNAGSHFLGFVIAAIALLISYAPMERKAALLSPIFILWLPIFDTSFLVFMRIAKKILPFRKSNDHLAFRFLALGYSGKKALFAMFVLCLFFALCGVLISQMPNLSGMIIVFLVALVSFALIIRMSKVIVKG